MLIELDDGTTMLIICKPSTRANNAQTLLLDQVFEPLCGRVNKRIKVAEENVL